MQNLKYNIREQCTFVQSAVVNLVIMDKMHSCTEMGNCSMKFLNVNHDAPRQLPLNMVK